MSSRSTCHNRQFAWHQTLPTMNPRGRVHEIFLETGSSHDPPERGVLIRKNPLGQTTMRRTPGAATVNSTTGEIDMVVAR